MSSAGSSGGGSNRKKWLWGGVALLVALFILRVLLFGSGCSISSPRNQVPTEQERNLDKDSVEKAGKRLGAAGELGAVKAPSSDYRPVDWPETKVIAVLVKVGDNVLLTVGNDGLTGCFWRPPGGHTVPSLMPAVVEGCTEEYSFGFKGKLGGQFVRYRHNPGMPEVKTVYVELTRFE